MCTRSSFGLRHEAASVRSASHGDSYDAWDGGGCGLWWRPPLLFLFVLCWIGVSPSYAQQQDTRPDTLQQRTRSDSTRPDTLAADTTRTAPDDSLRTIRDPGSAPPSVGPSGDAPGSTAPSGRADNAVTFAAQDSLIITFDEQAGDEGSLYGTSSVAYQDATLKADTIRMAFDTETLQASGRTAPRDATEKSPPSTASPPTTSGSRSGGSNAADSRGRPAFQRGATSFTGDVLSYNLRTKRGRVVAARTEEQNGFVQGNAVKVYEDSTVFVRDGTYTTCNCGPEETPSYSLRSNRMKVRGQWVYTGPIQLFLFNIPTPLWLPFGILPATEGRRSGPLPPRYGEDQRGIFLRDWGWYFAMNDYTDLQLRGSIWSQGSFEIRPLFRYRKRYTYNGQLELTYQRDRRGESRDPTFQNRHEGELRWSHQQTLSPTATFGGNVNLVTSSDFSRRNTESFDEAIRQQITSNIRYSKQWPGGGRSLNISTSQRQQLQSGQANLTLPSLDFSQRRFKPFARDSQVGEERWYEKITTQYDLSVNNRYTFNPRDPEQLRARGDSALAAEVEAADIDWYEALVNRDKYQLATGDDEPFDFEATHRIPVQASFRVNRFNLNLSPSVDYQSDWFISTRRKQLVLDSTFVESTTGADSLASVDQRTEDAARPGFYARHDFSTSLSASSELFGTFPVGVGPFRGLRHRLQPSLSFRFQPNFNDPFWGRTRSYVADTLGTIRRYDIVTGRDVRGSTEQRSLSFSLGNEFETKRVRVDTTGEEQTDKLKLLDLDLRSSYNFAADSLKLSDIRLNARTNLFDRLRVTANMTFSPYALRRQSDGPDDEGRLVEVDQYMFSERPWTPMRLTRFRMSVSGSFQSARRTGQPNPVSQPRARFSDAQNAGRLGPYRGAAFNTVPDPYTFYPNTPTGYVDFSIPWSVNLDLNYSFRKPRKEIEGRRATLGANFDFSVTPLWKVSGRTGYDLVQKELSTTRLSVFRDLGCWQMSFDWVPFGEFQSYSFSLSVKSGKLSQLLRLQIPQQGDDSRLGGFGGQLRGTVQQAAGGSGFGGSRF